MTFKEFCKVHKLTKDEKRQAAILLMAFRLFRMWEQFIGEDDD